MKITNLFFFFGVNFWLKMTRSAAQGYKIGLELEIY